MTGEERLAAEYALGLLDGEECLAARARHASDPDFAAAVAWWEDRLAPLLDEIGGVEPDEDLWRRIEAAIDEDGAGGEVVALRRSVRRWQGLAGLGIAACLALAVFTATMLARPDAPGAVAPPSPAEAPLMASIPIGDTPLRLGVTYLPERGEMLVSASGLTADGVHDHELWLVPPEGELRSLGVVRPGEQVRMPLDPAIAALIHDGSRMVLTREPLGGKPPEEQAGPVVAEGSFAAI